ncbi:MarR family winged helix-turn-helix transcriptional regulator [Blastococcus sp. Marseille-P5729]|uniref:MarR family winged helix-turn-helix transcriptional regulator n=1 Tax=Blastococcus sp. Marseille-P5729 TaxID=2086582 RepID=UPI00131D50EC|nr:MarR family transcriptional regulator [Blastococcus sp. Marseille-P5729]
MADDTEELAELVRHVSRALRRRTHAIAEPYGLTPHQLRAVRLIAYGTPDDEKASHPLRISDIAERMRIVARSVTDVVDDLEAKGLVRRAPHPTDRRSTIVDLTAQGRSVLEEVESRRAEDARQFFGQLTADERRQLRRLLRRLDT